MSKPTCDGELCILPTDTRAGGDTGTGPEIIYDVPLHAPLVTDIYAADPSAHVFEGVLYIYVSHDRDFAMGDFNMVDHHLLSLDERSEFVDLGEILNVDQVPWATEKMWAPDAAFKDGTYYFYFPAKDDSGVFRIGVATGPSPTGPFTPEPQPIPGSYSIDPAVFIDDDGQAYMYFGGLWGGQLECWKTGTYNAACPWQNGSEPALGPRVVRLTDDMTRFDGAVTEIDIVDQSGTPLLASDESRRYFEGVWMHKLGDTYYLSYSTGTTHLIVYATGSDPMGPFTYGGVVIPNLDSGWTTHHSIVEFQDRWYLFFHDASCSGGIIERRCVKVEELHYDQSGEIQEVVL
jgi:hypothetical protein